MRPSVGMPSHGAPNTVPTDTTERGNHRRARHPACIQRQKTHPKRDDNKKHLEKDLEDVVVSQGCWQNAQECRACAQNDGRSDFSQRIGYLALLIPKELGPLSTRVRFFILPRGWILRMKDRRRIGRPREGNSSP